MAHHLAQTAVVMVIQSTLSSVTILQYTDLAIPTLSLDFVFRRTYNSAAPNVGPGLRAGPTAITSPPRDQQHTVVVMHGDGRRGLYTDDTTGNYLPAPAFTTPCAESQTILS